MTKKFNPKQFLGKKETYVTVPFAPRVSRLWEWSEKHHEYRAPENKKAYMARRWCVDPNGVKKREYQFFDSLEAARVWQSNTPTTEAPAINSLPENSPPPKTKSGPLFSDVIAEWKRRRFSAMEESTQVRYENIVALYFGSLTKLTIHEITPQRLDLWLDELKDPKSWTMKSKKRKMFDHELSLLSTILKYYIDYHDDPDFQFPIKKRHKEAVWLKRKTTTTDKQLSEEAFLRFRKQMEALSQGEVLASMATVQYYQALRISEVAALSWEDLHLDQDSPENSRLKVRKKVYWPRNKGVPSVIKIGFKNADSGDNQGVKEQPLFPESCEALMKLYTPGAKGLIFKTEGSHFSYRVLQNRYRRAFKLAELPHTGTHIMRHGGCSRLFDERGDLGVAKQILGNSTLRSVEVYARRSKTALTDVAKKHWEKKRLRLVASGGGN